MGDFAGLTPWRAASGRVPAYQTPSNAREGAGAAAREPERRERAAATTNDDDLREELRRIIVEELHDLIGGGQRG